MAKALAILGGTPISFSYQDVELRYVWFENAPADWPVSRAIGETDLALLPEPAASALLAAKRDVVLTGKARKYEMPVGGEAEMRHFDLYLQPDRDQSGTVVGLLCAMVDVSERRRSEQTRQMLLREVTHRSKNLLAIVTSLATQTARTARSIDDFLARFNGRLQSISRSQDLITETNWRGAKLSELIATQVEPYAAHGPQQVSFAGCDHYLKPNAALHVGLALHELAVNSVQGGALSSLAGRLSVTAERLPADDQAGRPEPALLIAWSETGGPGGNANVDEFGRVLLERLVPAAVGGTAKLTAGVKGLRYKLTLLRREFE